MLFSALGDTFRSPKGLSPIWPPFKKTLASADEFIDKAATETISGYKYRVAFADGTSVDLATWLRQQLVEQRKASAEAP